MNKQIFGNNKIVWFSLLILLIINSGAVLAEPEIGSELFRELENNSKTRAIITLRSDVLIKENFPSSKKLDNDALLQSRVQKVSELQKNSKNNLISDGFEIIYEFKLSPAYSGWITKESLDKLSTNPNVKQIESVPSYSINLKESPKAIHARRVQNIEYQNIGYLGNGATVCVLDTGVDYTHPNLGGCTEDEFLAGTCSKIIGGHNYCANGECTEENDNPLDNHGHGTHISGIIVSDDGTFKGIAPHSKIVAVKVLNSSGWSGGGSIKKGVEWCIMNRNNFDPPISIISMSLGDGAENPGACSSYMQDELDLANDLGLFVIAASGNENFQGGINHPACYPSVISVGATYDGFAFPLQIFQSCVDWDGGWWDKVACFTNRGSNLDLLAPGVWIKSTNLNWEGTCWWPISTNGCNFVDGAGTSQAVPHVSGSIALINQYLELNNIEADVDQVKQSLIETGRKIYDSATGLTFPRIDVYRAIYGHFHVMDVGESLDAYVYEESDDSWTSKIQVGEINKLKVSLDWGNGDELKLSLIDPDGNLYTSTTNPRASDGLTVYDPEAGVWKAKIETINVGNILRVISDFTIKTKALSNEGIDPGGGSGGGAGGVNFSSINLNYISTCSGEEGLTFAVKGEKADTGDIIVNTSKSSNQSIRDFMTGLVIPNHEQWITMDIVPDGEGGQTGSVDRVDEELRETETGAVLLDADVKLKFDQFASPEAQQLQEDMLQYWIDDIKSGPYWDELNSKGFNEVPRIIARSWVVPDNFAVNGSGCNVFIEEATLGVDYTIDACIVPVSNYNLRPELEQYIQNRSEHWRNEYIQRHKQEVTPNTVELINSAPEYEELRRVYTSLAIAQWYKQQDMSEIPFGEKINSDNISGLESEVPFDQEYWEQEAYQKLYTHEAPCGLHGETCTYTWYGGMMLSSVPPEVLGNLTSQMNEIVKNATVSNYSKSGDDYYFGGALKSDTPDLNPNAIWSNDLVTTGKNSTISVMIRNKGKQNSGEFKVSIYDQYTHPNGYENAYLLDEKTVSNLAPDEHKQVDIKWNTDLLGNHTLSAFVDSSRDVIEISEMNNVIKMNATAYSPYPIVQITSPSKGDVFSVGSEITLSAEALDYQDGFISENSLEWKSSINGKLGSGYSLIVSNLSEGTHILTLNGTDNEGFSTEDQVGITINPQGYPTARIDSPRGGAFAEGETVYFDGYSSDEEDGVLSGASIIWTSDLDGQIGTGSSFNTANLSVGAHEITFTATDSANLSSNTSISIEILEGSPSASILSPADKTQAFFSYPVKFNGTGNDPQDGDLTGTALSWYSDIDGYIGGGTNFTTTELSEGTHTITLTARDSHGLQAMDIVELQVNPPGYPVASVTSPRNTGKYIHGNDILFNGTAVDADDGELNGSSLIWVSNIDGQIGTGQSFTKNSLSIGNHTVTLTAENSNGKSTSLDLNIFVTSSPPEPEISSPSSGSIFEKDASISFSGSASDLEDGSLSGSSLVWTSSLDGQIGTGNSFSKSDLLAGSHKIKLTATDSHEVTSEVISNIVIASPGDISTNIFSDGSTEKAVDFGKDGGSNTVYLKVWKEADVDIAKVDISGSANTKSTKTNDIITSDKESFIPNEIKEQAPEEFKSASSSSSGGSLNGSNNISLQEKSNENIRGSYCNRDGYANCYENTYSYGSATAHAVIASSGSNDRGEYNYVNINGVSRKYYVDNFWIYYLCEGDKAYYRADINQMMDCGSSGCNGIRVSNEGQFSVVSAPSSSIPSFEVLCWDKDTNGGYWAWTAAQWHGWITGGSSEYDPLENTYVLGCGYDSDCSSDQFCDKRGSWETWECKIPTEPTNPKMDATDDGDYEWSYSGIFTGTERTSNFKNEIQNYLNNDCTDNICLVPIKLSSDTKGTLTLSNLDLQYTIHDTEPPVINSFIVSPSPAYTTDTLSIEVNATDNTNITSANFSVAGNSVDLNYNSGTGLYEGSISAPSAGIYEAETRVVDMFDLESKETKTVKITSASPELRVVENNTSYSPEMVFTGDEVNASSKIENIGKADADNFEIALLVDGNAVNTSTASINSGSSLNETLSWTAEYGGHTISIKADSSNKFSETNENDNEVSFEIVVSDNTAPMINSINLTPKETFAGEQISAKANVSDNIGISSVRISVNGSKTNLSYNPATGLYEGTFTVSNAGIYSASIIAIDIDNLTASKSTKLEIYGNEPDLEVNKNDIELENTISDGKSTQINVTVKNNGKTDASNALIKFEIGNYKENKTITIPAESELTSRFNWTAVYGTSTIEVQADPEGNILETNEENNNATKLVSVSDSSSPLITSIEYSPLLVHESDQMNIEAKVADNVGVDTVKATLDTSEVVLSESNGIYEGATSAPPENNYLLEVTANDTSGLTASRSKQLQVYSNKADISINKNDISFNPKKPSDLQEVNISVLVKNTGATDADNFYVDLDKGFKTLDRKQISVSAGSSKEIVLKWNATFGSHELEIKADSTNVISESNESNNEYLKQISVVDITPPPAPEVTADPPGWSEDDVHNIEWNGVSDTNGIDRYEYQINYGSWTPVGTSTSFTTNKQPEGVHTVYVRAVDSAGNIGNPGNVSIHVDKSSPNAPVLNEWQAGNNWSSNQPSYTWNNPGDSGSGIAGYIGNINGSSINFDKNETRYEPDLTTGLYDFKVKAIDKVGHESAWSNIVKVYIDNTPPEISKVNSDTHPDHDKKYSERKPNFEVSAQDKESGVYGYYYLITKNENDIPDKYSFWSNETKITADSMFSSMQETNRSNNLNDGFSKGTWYFHVIAMDNVGNLGTEPAHYKFMIGEESGGGGPSGGGGGPAGGPTNWTMTFEEEMEKEESGIEEEPVKSEESRAEKENQDQDKPPTGFIPLTKTENIMAGLAVLLAIAGYYMYTRKENLLKRFQKYLHLNKN